MKLPNIIEDNNFVSHSYIRRVTFKTNKITSKIRLIYKSFFNFSSLRYERYINLCIERLGKKSARNIKHIQESLLPTVIDENFYDKKAYFAAVRIIEQQIEDINPTIH